LSIRKFWFTRRAQPRRGNCGALQGDGTKPDEYGESLIEKRVRFWYSKTKWFRQVKQGIVRKKESNVEEMFHSNIHLGYSHGVRPWWL
jgi:hypothetical protein